MQCANMLSNINHASRLPFPFPDMEMAANNASRARGKWKWQEMWKWENPTCKKTASTLSHAKAFTERTGAQIFERGQLLALSCQNLAALRGYGSSLKCALLLPHGGRNTA